MTSMTTLVGCGGGGNSGVSRLDTPGLPENPVYPQPPTGPVFYVEQRGGNDQNPGTNDQPWATVQHAINMAKPGDTIFIKPGIYGEVGVPNNFHKGTTGTPDAWITIEGYPHHKAIIRGGFSTRGATWIAPGGGWIRFKGLRLNGGISVHNTQNAPVEILDNIFDFFSTGGTAVSGSTYNTANPNDVIIRNNYIYGAGFGITTGDKARNWLVENNIIERIIKRGKGGDADYIRVHGSGHIFRGNVLFGTRYAEKKDAHTDGFQTFTGGARDILIENNIISSFDQGIMASTSDGSVNENWTIRNNIFSGAYPDSGRGGAWGICIHANSGTAKNWVIVNNVFANNVYHGVALGPQTSEMTVKNNIFYNCNMYVDFNRSRTDMYVGYNMTNRTSTNPLATDIVGVNPLLIFVDPVDCYMDPLANPHRFALSQGSPAINAGTALPGVVDKDIRGVSRPRGSGWDIGAYEYGE